MGRDARRGQADGMEPATLAKEAELGAVSGVYIPVVLNVLSILMFLRFGSILGQIGLLGILGLLAVAYFVDLVTVLSLSAIASNGVVKGGGAYYLISRSLGPEFGGSIGVMFYLSQVMNTALNVVGLIDCLKLNIEAMPGGFWEGYMLETCALVFCTAICLAGSRIFAKANDALFVILIISILSIPLSTVARRPFTDPKIGVEFTGISSDTFLSNLYPPPKGPNYKGTTTFRNLFGVLFPATSGIFAGASMSGDLKNPSKAIPKGTLWGLLSTLLLYLIVIFSMASSITHQSFVQYTNVLSATSMWAPLIMAGECATTFFSVLMGLIGSAKLLQALARDKLLPGLQVFGRGTKHGDEPQAAILITYAIAQVALFADLNQIATSISMGYQMTFLVMNLACFLLKIGSAPNFRPAFKFFSWKSALLGSILSVAAMFFIDETYATSAVILLFLLFLLIHYMSPPKHWGDVSQNLIYHQVRKYLLRLKPEHIKFWRPQIILLINDPRRQTRLIQFCNSMKKGSLYILGHVIVTDDFKTGIHEAKLQQAAWTKYISEYSKIKAFVQLTMSPSIEWGVRNLILSAGLGGMRPNIAVMGFYNMDDLRRSKPPVPVPINPVSPPLKGEFEKTSNGKEVRRRRSDTVARILDGVLPTDAIRTEGMLSVTSYLTIVEDLALRHKLNVAIGKGFETLETPRHDGSNTKRYIDLWPIQMSAEIDADGTSVLTTNFDTFHLAHNSADTLILQLGYILHTVPTWKHVFRLRILVFVEYETEVDEERARLKSLLDKLRIDAEVVVSWLASGALSTYEYIINGKIGNTGSEGLVDELLSGDEWWEELQRIRRDFSKMSRLQELSFGQMLETARRRNSFNNPFNTDGSEALRRFNIQEIKTRPRRTTVSRISKLGASLGIRTHHLGPNMVNNDTKRVKYDSSDDESVFSSSSDDDFNDAASEGDLEDTPTVRQPLLSSPPRRSSHGDFVARPNLKGKHSRDPSRAGRSGRDTPSYGAMGSTWDKLSGFTPVDSSQLSDKIHTAMSTGESSRGGDNESKTPSKTTATKPSFSRNPSMGRFSSRPVPETRMHSEQGGERLAFVEPEPSRVTFARSRRNSGSQNDPATTFRQDFNEPHDPSQTRPGLPSPGLRSSYSAQSMPLSFNDIPSRAQHLIINELMRQHSSDTSVLLTTLPIPDEGTCESEEASVQYLSDIEVLCHELPPTLLVLSNSMTVTTSL